MQGGQIDPDVTGGWGTSGRNNVATKVFVETNEACRGVVSGGKPSRLAAGEAVWRGGQGEVFPSAVVSTALAGPLEGQGESWGRGIVRMLALSSQGARKEGTRGRWLLGERPVWGTGTWASAAQGQAPGCGQQEVR